jgi:hypothetical protein
MESRSVTPAIGTEGARARCDIRVCGIWSEDRWPGSKSSLGAFCPCRAWVHVARGRVASTYIVHHALHSACRDMLASLARTSSTLLHSGTMTMRGCGNRHYSSPPQERASGGQGTVSSWPEAALAHAMAVAPCSLSTGSRETARKGVLSCLPPSSSPWASWADPWRTVGGAVCQSAHPTFACPFARNEVCSVERAPHGPRHTESWIENPRPRRLNQNGRAAPLHDRHPAHHMRVTTPADR